MRPRNWCSWARPKRSACSMTMIVASGTSTPTSITVVATKRSISPLANAAVHQAHAPRRQRRELPVALLGRREVRGLRLLDHRADPIDLGLLRERSADRRDDVVEALQGHGPGVDRPPAR